MFKSEGSRFSSPVPPKTMPSCPPPIYTNEKLTETATAIVEIIESKELTYFEFTELMAHLDTFLRESLIGHTVVKRSETR